MRFYYLLIFFLFPISAFSDDSNIKIESLERLGSHAFWLFLIPALYIIYKYKISKKKNIFFKTGLAKSVIFSVSIALTSILIVNILFSENKSNDAIDDNLIKESLQEHINEEAKVKSLINNSDLNLDHHYNYIHYHFSLPKVYRMEKDEIHREDNSIINFYSQLIQEGDSIGDLGSLGLGMCYFYSEEYPQSLYYLNKNHLKNYKYRNYYLGLTYLKLNNKEKAVELLENEIQLTSGFSDGTYSELVPLLIDLNREDDLYKILQKPELIGFVPPSVATDLYLKNGDLTSYYSSVISMSWNKINLIGFIAATIILIVWLFYIKNMDLYEKENLNYLLLTLFLGMVFTFLSFGLSDFNQLILGYKLSGEKWNDFFYSIMGIGAIEELVKIIPLLIILIFSRQINEPFDYMLYASVSALGFSFVENLMYFNDHSLNIIHGRALTSTVGHMFFSSLIAYGLIISKYRFLGISSVLSFIAFFILGSLAHGIYDYLLFYNMNVLFIFYFLFTVVVWTILINNSLNNSEFFSYDVKLKADQLQIYICVSLTSILFFEYFVVAWERGPLTANDSLIGSMVQGSIMIAFFTTKLSRFDFVKGYWNSIFYGSDSRNDYSTYDMYTFFTRIFIGKSIHPKNFIGNRINIKNYKHNEVLKDYISQTIIGTIVNRFVINITQTDNQNIYKDAGFFLVLLEEPINWDGFDKEYFLIKFANNGVDLMSERNILVLLFAIPDKKILEEHQINFKELKYFGRAILNSSEKTFNKLPELNPKK